MISSRKVPKPGVFSGPYFPVFGGNTEIYRVNLYIQSEYRKIRTRKNSDFGYFSCSVTSFSENVIIEFLNLALLGNTWGNLILCQILYMEVTLSRVLWHVGSLTVHLISCMVQKDPMIRLEISVIKSPKMIKFSFE